MIIKNGTLFSVSEEDLTPNGELHLPNGITRIIDGVGNSLNGLKALYLPDSMKRVSSLIFNNNQNLKTIYFGKKTNFINYAPFKFCPNITAIQIPDTKFKTFPLEIFFNLKKVIIRQTDDKLVTRYVKKYRNSYYYESNIRNFGKIKTSILQKVSFTNSKEQAQKICLSIPTKGRKYFIEEDIKSAIIECRKYLLMQEFEYAILQYKTQNNIRDEFYNYDNILRSAMEKYIYNSQINFTKERIQKAKEHIRNIPKYTNYIQKFFKKYDSIDNFYEELLEIPIDKLSKKLTPKKTTNKNVNKSCTRWLRRHPVTIDEMYSIVRAGYKNPGSFPYSWLKKIPKSQRGNATERLHKLFKKTTSKLYGPNNPSIQEYINLNELKILSTEISKIIKQPIDIKYLGSGEFSKTYTLEIPGDKKYVWKIYHCDNTDAYISSYYHDTELQNSFLLGGKKYYGKIKFRNISTAGISNQRGEIYLIYPYTDGEPVKTRIHKPNQIVQKYSLLDKNQRNVLGNTIIDLGALRINYLNWQQPKHVSKIMNTILYHSWNDLGYILNNYSSIQIRQALSFISENMYAKSLDFYKIQKKIDFLKQKAKIR